MVYFNSVEFLNKTMSMVSVFSKQMPEDKKSETRRQMTENRGQKSETRRQRTENRSQMTDDNQLETKFRAGYFSEF